MNKKEQTIKTYNVSAQALAKKFDRLGVRRTDIQETLQLMSKNNPHVFEIGCGNGRDAQEIVRHTSEYLGIDVSEQLITLARLKVPDARFEIADVEGYGFQKGIDVIFAFASLIHVPKESLRAILHDTHLALNEGGVFRISLKYASAYSELTQEDEFGIRTYYLYSQDDIEEVAHRFHILKNEIRDVRGQQWLEILLRKNQSVQKP